MTPISFTVAGLARPQRLDRVLREQFPRWGRQAVGRLINGRQVQVNGRIVWLSSWQVKNGDRIEVADPPAEKLSPFPAFDDAWIIAQHDGLIAVNKPAGLLCHQTLAQRPGDLLSLARARFGPVSLFHRLDRDTSGVVLLSQGGAINRYLDAAFKAGTVKKEYLALVPAGDQLAAEGVIRLRLASHPQRRDRMTVVERGGKWAETRYQVLGEAEGLQLVQLFPTTGRTHQLRVHLQALGAPVLGDRLYGPQLPTVERLMLHAWRISLPAEGGVPARSLEAPLPAGFRSILPNPLHPLC